jgi:phosphotransferase system  glucose/maltose/N-acetylglucosamine-specific IIC component
MTEQEQSLHAIHDIKRMMERSSRFISLSGLSGISAGICALIGAWLAYPYVMGSRDFIMSWEKAYSLAEQQSWTQLFNNWLFWIAAGTFAAAFVSAFLFTYLKSKKICKRQKKCKPSKSYH